MKLIRLLMPSLAAVLSACAYEVGFDAEYVTEETPSYIAEAEIVVLMHPHDTESVYQGTPTTEVGSFTTLTVPIGNIMQEITAEVFQTCFAYGVVFTQELTNDMAYIVAIEPEIMNFSYGYDRVPLDPTGGEEMPRSITTPQVEFDLSVRAYDSAGSTMLERTYASGLVSGESYEVTNRPYERINETFHGALHELMVRVADDIRPLLVGQCDITDFAS
jgi:hypothetical protein